MVRNPVAFICTILISSAAIALPRPAVLEGPSMAVRVEESSENRAIPDACRNADESPCLVCAILSQVAGTGTPKAGEAACSARETEAVRPAPPRWLPPPNRPGLPPQAGS